MLRLATVGTSAIMEMFVSAAQKSARFELHTAYSRSPERAHEFALRHSFSDSCSDITALASNPNIDAVYIASPNSLHYAQSKLFLENGKHVLCEKPITTDCAKFDELYSLAREKGLIYVEAIMNRHSRNRDPIVHAISQLGRISLVKLDFCQRSSRYDSFLSGAPVNIFDMSLGAGTLADLGIYCVWAAVDLFGMPESIKASASYFHNGADCSGAALFEYDGFTAVLSYSKAGQSASESEIVGDSGSLKIASISQYAGASLIKNGSVTELTGFPSRDELMGDEARKFADFVEQPDITHKEYTAVSQLTHAAHTCMDIIKHDAGIKYDIKETVL